jgi:carbamoyl-phosphate synthase large subunit
MNILLTSVGSNTAISVIKGLKLSNILGLRIVGTDTNDRRFCAGSNMVDSFQQIVSVHSDDYDNAIIKLIQEESIDCVIGIHDLEIEKLSALKAKYPELTFWAIPDQSVIEICNDKDAANEMCSSLGFNVPTVYDSNETKTWSKLPKPIIVKPKRGVSSSGVQIFESFESFVSFNVGGVSKEFIIQELVHGDEFTVDCYSSYIDGSFVGAVVRKRIETKAGISVKGVVIEDEEIVELCRILLLKLGLRGACNIQFIRSHDKVHFIEINPRFSGAGILSYKAGLNSPLYTITEASGCSLNHFAPISVQYGMSMTRYWQEQFCDYESAPI